MLTEPVPSSPAERNVTLEEAWTRFGKYDLNAVKARKRFVRQRKLILGLTVAATTLAVAYSVTERHLKAENFPFSAWVSYENALHIFHAFVVIAPIALSILIAGSIRFNQGISWIMLRTSAEAIKKEIFCYRMRVADYSDENTKKVSRDMILARKLKMISKRLMETQVNQIGLEHYKGVLPPAFGTDKQDDGFSDLNSEDYIRWRVENQFNYYQKKAFLLGKELQQFQWLVFILGGLGTLLAAFGFDVWIAVSSAFAAAFTGFLEFKRVETNVIACNLSAADLYDIRIWWHALSPTARTQQANIETLVSSTEAVLQTENAGWLQEMREALAEIYREKKEAGGEIPNEEEEHRPDIVDRIFAVRLPLDEDEPSKLETASSDGQPSASQPKPEHSLEGANVSPPLPASPEKAEPPAATETAHS
jgi:hypothetical protein